MANFYNNTNNNYYAPQEPDEISLFLQQILLRSSTSSSPSFLRQHSLLPTSDHVAPDSETVGQISAAEPLSVVNSCSKCSFEVPANVSPSSVGNLGNETDDCGYESEEAIEALVSETAAKSAPRRCSSKRSRAAEVHNLSEKRRRSRINEKMKALQNLIPNSNKTDKASMLDEAIEYLKQLQLQVQMLTMRKGLSLYPLCLPGMLHQPDQISEARLDVYGTDKCLYTNAKEMGLNHSVSADSVLRIPENCVKQEHVSDFSSMNDKTSVDAESSLLPHQFGAFQLCKSSKKEKLLPCLPMIEDRQQGRSAGAKVTSSIPVEAQTSRLKDDILESCVAGAADILLSNYVNNQALSHRN